ncbi:DUF4032 domain-containing protein [bacterium]|nr:DUF4032 domain-containing protein [bacterium]
MAALSAIENTALYRKFLEEREHILRNKWFMSEKEGHDVGFERALLNWVNNFRNKWLQDNK